MLSCHFNFIIYICICIYIFLTIFWLCFPFPCIPSILNPFPLLHWIAAKLSRKPAAARLVIPFFRAALLFSSSSSPNRCLIMLRHPLLRCASPPGPFGVPSVCCCLSPPAGPVNLRAIENAEEGTRKQNAKGKKRKAMDYMRQERKEGMGDGRRRDLDHK